jgi:hypothetical protein
MKEYKHMTNKRIPLNLIRNPNMVLELISEPNYQKMKDESLKLLLI